VTKRMMGEVSIPLIATNRINSPEVAEKVLQDGCADMVSMARPFLADAEIVLKAMEDRSDEINTCIACNQACLDHTFTLKICSCLVNARACHETILNFTPTDTPKRLAVIGAGPAGMAAATLLAERGHSVDLFEAESEIGGQFNMAKVIPGKEEYAETIRYYSKMIEKHGVNLYVNHRATANHIIDKQYEEVIIATGVTPRRVDIPGVDHPKVLDYSEVLYEKKEVGKSVAIIGAGGIGFDMAEFLAHDHHAQKQPALVAADYMDEWGVDMTYARGGSLAVAANPAPSEREIYLLKRSKGKHGKNLGKTTGWIHRSSLAMKQVKMLAMVEYVKIDDMGLHILVNNEPTTLAVDNIIVCAGQEPLRDLLKDLENSNIKTHLIGGADVAAELDAKKAIYQASYLASEI